MGDSTADRAFRAEPSTRSPLISSRDQHAAFVCLSNATTCRKSKGVTSFSCFTRASDAEVQSAAVAIAFAARSSARYRSSSTRGDTAKALIIEHQSDYSGVWDRLFPHPHL